MELFVAGIIRWLWLFIKYKGNLKKVTAKLNEPPLDDDDTRVGHSVIRGFGIWILIILFVAFWIALIIGSLRS